MVAHPLLGALALTALSGSGSGLALDNGLGLHGPPMVRGGRRWCLSNFSDLLNLLVFVDDIDMSQGWSSWNHFKGDITAALAKEIADAMVSSGLAKLGCKNRFPPLWFSSLSRCGLSH